MKEIEKTFQRIRGQDYIVKARLLPGDAREAAEKNQELMKKKREADADLVKNKTNMSAAARAAKKAKAKEGEAVTSGLVILGQEQSQRDDSDEGESQLFPGTAPAASSNGDIQLSEEEILWTLNHPRFLDDFRHSEVQEFVDRKFSPSHSWIIRGLLANSKRFMGSNTMRTVKSRAAASVREIRSWIEQQPSAPRLTSQAIDQMLGEMLADSSGFLERERRISEGEHFTRVSFGSSFVFL